MMTCAGHARAMCSLHVPIKCAGRAHAMRFMITSPGGHVHAMCKCSADMGYEVRVAEFCKASATPAPCCGVMLASSSDVMVPATCCCCLDLLLLFLLLLLLLQIAQLTNKQQRLQAVLSELQESRDKAAAALAKLCSRLDDMAKDNMRLRTENEDLHCKISTLKSESAPKEDA